MTSRANELGVRCRIGGDVSGPKGESREVWENERVGSENAGNRGNIATAVSQVNCQGAK
jgi:hypothetical protein